ncbi:MAG: choice-of-anchor N protein, partial [Candidatus Bathyarchaeota archaeon]|nr:choice-of-anchor N protein [Candidatus Bathyarchaeota archaeon]
MNRKISLVIVLLLASMLAIFPINIGAEGNPALLRLWADKGSYVSKNPDPWIEESWVVYGEASFTLYIDAKNWPVKNVTLIVAVNDTSAIGDITVGSTTITSGNFNYGLAPWPSGNGTIPRHGVYPTYYALIPFGNVNQNYGYYNYPYGGYWAYRANTTVSIVASKPVKVHFDAYGTISGGPQKGKSAVCPFSHDLTCIPTYALPPGEAPAISISKIANVMMAHVGDVVKYIYYVKNAGNFPLSNVYVADSLNMTVSYVRGDDDEDGLLDLGEVWIFEAEYVAPGNVGDDLYNEATAYGTYGGYT